MLVMFATAALLAIVGFIFGPLVRLAFSRRCNPFSADAATLEPSHQEPFSEPVSWPDPSTTANGVTRTRSRGS
jgi:hypothetical protein